MWQPVKAETAQLLREVHPVVFVDSAVEGVADDLIERNLKEEFEERRTLVHEYASGQTSIKFGELGQEVRYLLRENMKYWVEHWAIEEIAQELRMKRSEQSARK